MFVYEWKFLSHPSLTNTIKLLKVYDPLLFSGLNLLCILKLFHEEKKSKNDN